MNTSMNTNLNTRKCFVHPHTLYEDLPSALWDLGMEGYGIYNRMLELMSKDRDLQLPVKDIPRWARDMGVSILTLTQFIHRAIDEAVFSTTNDDDFLYSPWLKLQRDSGEMVAESCYDECAEAGEEG